MSKDKSEVRAAKWYFGGLASAAAACCTHPLDLVKVQMQTQKGKSASLITLTGKIVRKQGIRGLYNGISASLLRQVTYSTTRFGIFELEKDTLTPKGGTVMPFYMSILLAGLAGSAGGFVGNPADLVNVRMQNDFKLPPSRRRNYKNALHGLYAVARTEGVCTLWRGGIMNCFRAALMTIGQLSFYDQIKYLLLATSRFGENVTYVTSSLLAGVIATAMTQPVDVLKTRAMNAKPGKESSVFGLIKKTAKEGPQAFFKGVVPALSRIVPHTILTFLFLEQLRINFGDVVPKRPKYTV